MTRAKPPVLLLWGEDPFLLRESALEWLGDVQPREVDAAEWQGGETSDLATPSLFGERRALLVTDCRSLPDVGEKELAAYTAAPALDAPLVLVVTVAERGKPPAALVKMVESVGRVKEIKLTRRDLPTWLLSRAKRRNLELAPDGAAALIDTLVENAGALDQAVVQLANAFPGERVTGDHVHRQFRGLGEQHVWDLCDKAFGKDLAGSIRALRSLRESGDDPLLILGGVASRLRDLLKVKALPERIPPAELAREAGLRFEWQARRYKEQARRFTMEELVALHAQVTEADRALKSGATDDVVLPVLVSAIAGGRV